MCPQLAELQRMACLAQCPTFIDRLVEQAQQRRLGGHVDTVWDSAT